MKPTSVYHLLLTIALLFCSWGEGQCQSSRFTLVDARPGLARPGLARPGLARPGLARPGSAVQQATIVLAPNEAECVQLAVADLVSDVQKITGRALRVVTATPGQRYRNALVVGTLGQALVAEHLPESRQLAGKWENYRVRSVGSNLVLVGSDERGTMFAVYHFIEQYLGVDPLYFWSDREPAKQVRLSWDRVGIQQTTPTFRYRGWFINDEDLLTEWKPSGGKRNIDYPFYGQVVAPETVRHVVEALVRLRQNLLIPASFIDIRNPAEAALVREAARRGVFVSMHHVEPMGVSAFTYFNYWKAKDGSKPLFSYYSQREKLEEVWRVYAQEWVKYPNVIWQIGLRGIGDRPMWLADPGIPQSDADRGRLISEAMKTQMAIIREVDKRPNPPITTTLWAEGSVLNKAGLLQIPETVTVVFADNSPGWRMQADFRETPRLAAHTYGVYYHHQLWSSGPHLVQIVPPAQTLKVLRDVVSKGDTAYAILNVSNLREFVLGTDASARMLTNFSSFRLDAFQQRWFTQRYGKAAAGVQAVYQAYFDGFVMNSQTGTPMLMDGQIRSQTLALLADMRQQLTDSTAYATRRNQKKTETEESRWARTALGDMRGENLSREELLSRVLRQKTNHQRADSLARRVSAQLTVAQRPFFETNLLAHLDLMLGLENWLSSTIRAKIELDSGRVTNAKAALQQAVAAFDQMEQGLQRSRKPNWLTWYQGDKKMNTGENRRITTAIRDLANAPAKPRTQPD